MTTLSIRPHDAADDVAWPGDPGPGAGPRLVRSGAQLRSLLAADHHDRSVLLAEVEVEPGCWQLVGFAQYARIASDRADAAIVLEDAWQGRGVGRTLALQLVGAARAAGIA